MCYHPAADHACAVRILLSGIRAVAQGLRVLVALARCVIDEMQKETEFTVEAVFFHLEKVNCLRGDLTMLRHILLGTHCSGLREGRVINVLVEAAERQVGRAAGVLQEAVLPPGAPEDPVGGTPNGSGRLEIAIAEETPPQLKAILATNWLERASDEANRCEGELDRAWDEDLKQIGNDPCCRLSRKS